MRRFGTTMRSILGIGFTIASMYFLSAEASSSPTRPQSYVSKKSLAIRLGRPLSSQQRGYWGISVAQQMEDSVKVGSSYTLRPKDPNTAILYAVVPGVVVHGAGHFYAGEKTTGWILLGGEIVSIAMVTYSIASGFAEAMGASDADLDDEILGVVGVGLFMGTWIYDIIGAPLAVEKENRKLRGKKSTNLKFEFDDIHNSIKAVLVKQF